MLRWLGLKYLCSSAEKWKTVVSPHILRIVEQDERYSSCRAAMSMVASSYSDQETKTKCNMLFSAYSSIDSLAHLRPILSSLIAANKIGSQSQLDLLLKWLSKQIKQNSTIGQPEILSKLTNSHKQAEAFRLELAQIEKQEEINMNAVCKSLREKYATIDSKVIYEEVGRIAKGMGKSERKENKFWDKLKDIKPRLLKIQCNTKQITTEHMAVTSGRTRFRFPPQPNGYLHIGHLKAMRINFEAALRTGGTCYLRYDDTNPDKESHEYIQEIQNNIKWLGYTPDKITFASDYFEELEGLALKLVREGHAYVCQSTQEEIQHERKEKRPNPYRQRSIEENLKLFPNLTGSQTLRLKGLPSCVNPTLRDPVIYRQKSHPHPRTGSKFKIYPTYDFAHCTCDSLQHIDYSLCSLEFQIRRELYYTYLDLLGMWKPVVWEYSRLNIQGNVLSKRKIKAMIDEGLVEGWDDARLLTIQGLINRGYTPKMLIQFIDKVNASRSGNQNYVQFSLLEQEMKKVLLPQSTKAMAVLDPIKTVISNLDSPLSLNPQLQNPIFLESKDVQSLEQGQIIILKQAGVFKVESSTAQEVRLSLEKDQDFVALKKQSTKRVKTLHWISQGHSVVYPMVMYDRLLTPDNEVNLKSKIEYKGARVPAEVVEKRPQYVQFQRIGFFRFGRKGEQLQLCTKL